jgi:peptide/nickel transport system substrate-binding protein
MKLRTRRRAKSAAATAALATLLTSLMGAALAQAPTPTSSDSHVVFTVGTTSDMVSPNPFKACCGAEYEMMFMNYDMLYNFGKEDLSPTPALAKSSTHTDDYRTWTFEIRDDATWSDGEPLTAADLAFTYNFIVDNDMGSFNDYFPYDPTFTAPDDTTLVWDAKEPTFAPNTPPWVPILPEHVWSKFDGDPKAAKEFENVPSVGSGPFHLVEWKEGQFWRMEANPDHWMGTPTIDEVVFRVYDNQEAMVQALKSGEIDIADALIPSLFNSLKGESNIQTHVAPPGYFDNLAFNFGGQGPNATNHPALQDVQVRRAIAHAIDRQAIVDRVMLGQGTVGESITMPHSPWHWEPSPEEEYNYDPAEANRILDEAGYEDTDGDGVREMPDGSNPLVLDVLTVNQLTYSNDQGKLIQGFLDDIGIQVNLKPVSESKAYALWADGDFDAYIWGWGGDPDPDFILSIFTTDQCLSWSDGCYSNPQYDAMYEEQRTIADIEERKAFVAEMQQFIHEEVPEIVLAYENDLQAYRTDTFTGYVPVPQPDGFLVFGWGPYSYLNLRPVSAEAASASSDSGISTGVWLAIAAAVVVVAGGITLFRRNRGDEDQA